MKIKNISEGQLIFIDLLGEGRDVIINPGSISTEVLPNEIMLRKLISKRESIKLIVVDQREINMISSIDPSAVDLIE